MTKFDAFLEAFNSYFEKTPVTPKKLSEITDGILKEMAAIIDLHNAACQKDERWSKPFTLPSFIMSKIIMKLTHIRLINTDAIDSKKAKHGGVPGIYDPADGLYHIDGEYRDFTRSVNRLITALDGIVSRNTRLEIFELLESEAETVAITRDPNLIPVENGIFDYKTKALLPFSPEYVYLSKCPVAYVPNTLNPHITDALDGGPDWDVESWMASLSDDPEIIDLLWKVVGAVLRPNVRWNKIAALYSTVGNNGKGTFCELIRGLCQNPVNISVADFASNFALEQLVGADAVIADENDVGQYIDKAKSFKAAVTGDVIQINRKYRSHISYRFRGFIVQCFNDYPQIKDKTGSMARRLLYIPFEKSFTGAERRAIKDDFLQRQDVLEYVLQKVLNMDYSELPEPKACHETMKDYQINNNPVVDFAMSVLPELKWDLVPFTFLYDLYKAWFKENYPSGILINSRRFLNEIVEIVNNDPALSYECPDKTKRHRVTKTNMAGHEPLILKYSLTGWMNPMYKGSKPELICMPMLNDMYRGIIRKALPQNPPAGPDNTPDTSENDSQGHVDNNMETYPDTPSERPQDHQNGAQNGPQKIKNKMTPDLIQPAARIGPPNQNPNESDTGPYERALFPIPKTPDIQDTSP